MSDLAVSVTRHAPRKEIEGMLEASIDLIDHMNPSVGYQVRITRTAAPGEPITLLFTARNPATGEELLTYAQCLDVLSYYKE